MSQWIIWFLKILFLQQRLFTLNITVKNKLHDIFFILIILFELPYLLESCIMLTLYLFTHQNMAPSTRCYPMDFEPGTTELRLPTKSSISFILQPVLFKGNLTLSKILPPNLNARKFSIHFIYLVWIIFIPSRVISLIGGKFENLPWRLQSMYTRVPRQVHVDRQIHPKME